MIRATKTQAQESKDIGKPSLEEEVDVVISCSKIGECPMANADIWCMSGKSICDYLNIGLKPKPKLMLRRT